MKFPRWMKTFWQLIDTRRDIAFAALVVLTGVYFIGRWQTPYIHPTNDGDAYLLLARSIAEGKGYRDLQLPGEPVAAHFPAGWPFLLSLVYHAFGYTDLAYQIFMSFMYLFSGVIIYLLSRRFFRPWASYLVSFAMMSNMLLSEYTQTTLAEIPFVLFLYGGLFLYLYGDETRRMRYHTAGMCCLAFTTFIKFYGEVMLPVLGVTLLVKRKWRLLGVLVFLVALKVGVQFSVHGTEWISRGKLTKQHVASTVLKGGNIEQVKAQSQGLAQLILFNTRRMIFSHIPHHIFPSLYHTFAMNKLKMLLCGLLSLCVVAGMCVSLLFHRQILLPLTLAAMLAALATRMDAPFIFRYYAPTVPLLAAFGLFAVRKFLTSIQNRGATVRTVKTGLYILSAVFIVDRTAYVEGAINQNHFAQNPQTVGEFRNVSQCLKERTAGNVLIASPTSTTTFIATEKKSIELVNPDLWTYTWNTNTLTGYASFVKQNNCDYVLLPGWWITITDFDIAAFDQSLQDSLNHPIDKLGYGSREPTYLYRTNGSDNTRSEWSYVMKCLAVRDKHKLRTESLTPASIPNSSTFAHMPSP